MQARADGSTSSQRSNVVWLQLALALLVWALYANSLQGPFHFDDWHVIPENPSVRGPEDIPSFFTDVSTFSVVPGTRDYRPLFLSSMALAWWAGGGSVVPFHLISVSLHMFSVLLVFSIFRKMFGQQVPASVSRNTLYTAWLGAALFAVHPLATEPIDYISSQSVALSAVFYLASFRLFLAVYADPVPTGTPRSWMVRVGSYVAYAAALMSKPIAITLPINLLVWELLLASPRDANLVRRSRKYLPYAVLSIAFILWRSVVMTDPFGGGPARPVVEHYLTQTRAMVWYLGHSLIPLGLNVDRDYPTSVSHVDPRFLLAVLIMVALAWILYRFRKQRLIVFWSAWFPICLLLTTYGVIIHQVISEHRVYLSLVGYSAVVALLAQRAVLDKRSMARLGAVVVVVFMMSFYIYLTHARNAVWSSEVGLWRDSVAHGGGWRANMNYALALEKSGHADEALPYFQKAVELGSYGSAHTNLGLAYLARGDVGKGLEHLGIAVELRPASAEAHRYLAYGHKRNGDLEASEAELQVAIQLRPGYIEAYTELAALYEQRQQIAAAAEAYRRILTIDPAETWAEDELRRIVVLEPVDDELFQLAFEYQMSGDRQGASGAYEELLASVPDHRQGTFNLAYLYLEGKSRDDWARSVDLFERVLEIDPDYVESLFHLGTAHRQLANTERGAEYDRMYLERGDHQELLARARARLGH